MCVSLFVISDVVWVVVWEFFVPQTSRAILGDRPSVDDFTVFGCYLLDYFTFDGMAAWLHFPEVVFRRLL